MNLKRNPAQDGPGGEANLTPGPERRKPLGSLAELAAALPREGALLGLDVGTKTIGIAVTDPRRTIASPRDTIRRGRFRDDVEALGKLIAADRIAAVVVGLPVNMDGTEGPRCQSVRQFAANLLARIDLPLVFWDERLSTAAVTRVMLEADLSRQRRAQLADKLAAAYILQGALDALAHAARPDASRPADPSP